MAFLFGDRYAAEKKAARNAELLKEFSDRDVLDSFGGLNWTQNQKIVDEGFIRNRQLAELSEDELSQLRTEYQSRSRLLKNKNPYFAFLTNLSTSPQRFGTAAKPPGTQI